MEAFLKETIGWNKFELLIDTKIFPKDIILKAAYNFLDRGYFFFKEADNNILLQFTNREDSNEQAKGIIADFSDELLSVTLRDNLEKDNKQIRERIIWTAIWNSLDVNNFTSIDTDNNSDQNQIDFDKDIDDILKEIENDPELKIDEEEIEKILKEIEEETETEIEKPTITINPDAIKKAKEQFKK